MSHYKSQLDAPQHMDSKEAAACARGYNEGADAKLEGERQGKSDEAATLILGDSRTQLFKDVLVTCLEGGSNYWLTCDHFERDVEGHQGVWV